MSRPAVLLNVIVWGIGMGLMTLAIAGCVSTPGTLSAEQLRASGKEANAQCIEFFSPWGRGRTVFFNVDKNVIPNGSFTFDKDCGMTYTNSTPIPSPPQPTMTLPTVKP